MAHQLPALPYSFDALEPNIDATTMEIHHDRHHAGYVKKLNAAIEGTDAENLSLEDLMKNISKYPTGVRNNGGGAFNHGLFWTVLSPEKTAPKGELLEAINSTFGSVDKLKEELINKAKTQFGSGWGWICVDDNGGLCVCSTPNQDNPLMDVVDKNGTPIFGVDVWEHAYYLKYQNKRPDYLEAVWEVINWDEVAKRYAAAK